MPDVDLTLQEIKDPSLFLQTLGFMGNIRAGIQPYGQGLSWSAPIRAGIKDGASAPVQVEILAPSIADPTSPLAVHVGQGVVFVAWGHPTPDKVELYEVWAGEQLAGPYSQYQHGNFPGSGRWGLLRNLPVGATAYFQLRAKGYNGAFSNFVQVKLGKLEQPIVSLRVRAISGSTIAEGEVFTCVDEETGRNLAMQAYLPIVVS